MDYSSRENFIWFKGKKSFVFIRIIKYNFKKTGEPKNYLLIFYKF
jgi:hypothetical protein